MRVVVVGARGFIGAALLRRLERSAVNVLALASREIDLTRPGADEALAAVLTPDDALVFLSALTPDRGRDAPTMMRNLAMGQHACAALARQGLAHVIYVSSDAVYSSADSLISEDTPPSPQDLYAAMHLARELMFRAAVKAPLAILRPAAIYGSGDTHNGYGPNRFCRLALAGKEIALFGEGEEKRDHVFIDDAIEIIGLCLRHRSSGLLNLATGRSESFRDVAHAVVAAVGRTVPIKGTPRVNPVTHRHFDATATIRAFPDFHYRTLAEGLAHTRFVAAA